MQHSFRFLIVLGCLAFSGDLVGQSADRILTAENIKNYWRNTFPQPRSLDRDYHPKKREYNALLANIQSGALGDEAERVALRNNIAVYQGAGDTANAELTRQALADLEEKIAAEARLAEARKTREELESLRLSIDLLTAQRMMENLKKPLFP